MKNTLLLLVCAFALCFTAVAQDDASSTQKVDLIKLMEPRLQHNKDSLYAIEVAPHTTEFTQLLTAITLAGEVPCKMNYFFQPGTVARFFIAPRAFEYPSSGQIDYYECEYQYGQVSWHYNVHTQSCENVKIGVKKGNIYNQRGQLYDMQEGLYSLLEDVKHKRLYDFPHDEKGMPVFPSFLEYSFVKDSLFDCYSLKIELGENQDAASLFALLDKISEKTQRSIYENTYELITPHQTLRVEDAVGMRIYHLDGMMWATDPLQRGKVSTIYVHVYESDESHIPLRLLMYEHLLGLLAEDIQDDKWSVTNRI